MEYVQLEFNVENKTPEEVWMSMMQKQIDLVCESAGKVRRKLFSEMGEMKKLYSELKQENQELKTLLRGIHNEKTEWIYTQNENLFHVREYHRATG